MDWANANTYAPWQTPNEQSGNPSFGQQGQEQTQQTNLPFGYGSLVPFLLQSKKRSSPNFYAPSYQGQMFTPQEGLPSWYTDNDPNTGFYSQNGTSTNATMQSFPNSPSPMQPQQGSPFSLNGTMPMPNYIGQTYGGMNYAPAMGSSYGGYNSYGGYGASANTGNGQQSSLYQPFVPTGGIGQY